MRQLAVFALVVCTAACARGAAPPPQPPPAPATLDDFKKAVQHVLDETGVPGAGIALVKIDGVEWAGGIGFADRDRKTPVTADTHFRLGSISKTFVAIALWQLYENGDIDIEAPVTEFAPSLQLENPWEATDPVRVIHLLQHTAGFDDMHFNEMYNRNDPADMPLEDVLRINPNSRRVRWRPGSRFSYSNPGYAVAGHVIEKVTGEKFEDVIAKKIFEPIGMPTSSFRLTAEDEKLLAKGYRSRTGPPAGYSQIYLRPSGNMHSSPAEMGKFVQLLLNWGENEQQLVIDPEYLSNMEHPRISSSLAARAGLHTGYGSGIASLLTEPFPLLGHGGGIDGFTSQYAYSTSRDVGFVVAVNAGYGGSAVRRISDLAIRYLKREVEPPEKPQARMPPSQLADLAGYYHPANPRQQVAAYLEWLVVGESIRVDGDALMAAQALTGRTRRLIPTGNFLFRLENEVDASRVFTRDETGAVIINGPEYAVRVPRWRVEIVRWPVLISAAILLTPFLAAVLWLTLALLKRSDELWGVKLALLFCAVSFALPIVGIMNADEMNLGAVNFATVCFYVGTLLIPLSAVIAVFMTFRELVQDDAGVTLRIYAGLVSVAACIVSLYIASWGVIGFKAWSA